VKRRTPYNDAKAKRTERAYLSAEIVQQRERILEALAPSPGEFIVDLGCGPGLLTRAIAEDVGRDGAVLGLDLSGPMLGLARARCTGIPQLTLAAADAARLPVASGVADAVTAIQVLLYVERPQAAIAEMRRILRPGGRVVIVETDWQTAVVTAEDAALTRRMFDGWDRAVASPRLPQRLLPMLGDAGFDSVRVRAVPVLSTRYEAAGYAGSMIAQCAAAAVSAGRTTEQEARDWRAGIEQRAEAGAFLFCVTRFLFTAECR